MTDLEKIHKLIFSFPIPWFAQEMVRSLLTPTNIKKAYTEVGGEAGMQEVFAAFVRIGKEGGGDHGI